MLSMTTSDPWHHLCRLENTALLCLFSDGVKCKVFASTPPLEIMITCCNKLQRLWRWKSQMRWFGLINYIDDIPNVHITTCVHKIHTSHNTKIYKNEDSGFIAAHEGTTRIVNAVLNIIYFIHTLIVSHSLTQTELYKSKSHKRKQTKNNSIFYNIVYPWLAELSLYYKFKNIIVDICNYWLIVFSIFLESPTHSNVW